jgi:hypothetical protein
MPPGFELTYALSEPLFSPDLRRFAIQLKQV